MENVFTKQFHATKLVHLVFIFVMACVKKTRRFAMANVTRVFWRAMANAQMTITRKLTCAKANVSKLQKLVRESVLFQW